MISWIAGTSLLIVIVMALRLLLKGKIRPWVRYALWLVVLARLVIPFQIGETDLSLMNAVEKSPVVTEIESMRNVDSIEYCDNGTVEGYDLSAFSEDTPQIVARYKTEEEFQRMERSLHLRDILLTVWKVGVILVAAGCLAVNLRFRDRLYKSRRPLDGGFEGSAAPGAGRAASGESGAASSDGGTSGRRGSVPVYVTVAVETPCLYGLFQPAVYVTPEVASDPKTLRYAVEHEITHLRHGDQLWSAARCLCLAVQWFNPLVWIAAALSKNDCELACDEGTIKRLGEKERADYGRTLIELTKPGRNTLLVNATTMTGSRHALRERIEMIVRKPKMAVYAVLILVAAAIVGVVMTFTGASNDKVYDWLQSIETENIAAVNILEMQGDSDLYSIVSKLAPLTPGMEGYQESQAEQEELLRILHGVKKSDIRMVQREEVSSKKSVGILGLEMKAREGEYPLAALFEAADDGIVAINFDVESQQEFFMTEGDGIWCVDSPELAAFIGDKIDEKGPPIEDKALSFLKTVDGVEWYDLIFPEYDTGEIFACLRRLAADGMPVKPEKQPEAYWNIYLGTDSGRDIDSAYRSINITCGPEEDLVYINCHSDMESVTICYNDKELYNLVRHARDYEEVVDSEAWERLGKFVTEEIEAVYAVMDDGFRPLKGYEVTRFCRVWEYGEEDGYLTELYDCRFAVLADEPNTLLVGGTMYIDSQGRLQGNRIGQLAVRYKAVKKYGKETPEVMAFLPNDTRYDADHVYSEEEEAEWIEMINNVLNGES